MSILASLKNISKTYGTQLLFKNINMGFFEGERLGLIGPNGTGKSTLLKIIAGFENPDDGEIIFKKGIQVSYLRQVDEFDLKFTVEQALKHALKEQNTDEVQTRLRVQKILSLLEFAQPTQMVSTLSGGWKKRLSIGCALITEPDLLLMDEPTNHLDVEGILWLEEVLKKAAFAFLVITHDRYFLENVTNRIIELSPRYESGFLKTEGRYSDFLEKREMYINEQQKRELILSNKVMRETEWLRRGPKARTTKARYRINDALQLQDELRQVKQSNRSEKSVGFDFESNEKQSRVLLKTHNISKTLGDKLLINKLTLKLSPGQKIGLVGINGCGKSTLMKLLAGKIKPDEGTIKPGLDVKIVDFEQDRSHLNLNQTVKEALSPSGTDTVLYREKAVHIITWAKRLLFEPESLLSSVGSLSGGERARILIGRLMLQPADILLLDEPTNDLDIPSLEILEKSLLEFPGAIILVSHDRYLIDRVATSIISLDGQGGIDTFADLSQYLEQQKTVMSKIQKPETKPERVVKPKGVSKKLTYKDQYELDHIEDKIHKVESEFNQLKIQIEDPKVQSDSNRLQNLCEALHQCHEAIDTLYARWQELEMLAEELKN
ncbi:MAG: ABC-F family ATP-binding cassette domain-containing protein [Deltaproteobacteria bacterium]|nr:ABC-F family ATP-binding cassette domain-containing protein [Deltaproteobacteria bacterium]